MKKITSLIDDKLLRFIIVGVINTLVGSAIMFGLYNLANCSYWISSAANYGLTSVLSFFLNKKFTFRYKSGTKTAVWRFVINIAVCYTLAYAIAKPLVLYLLSGKSQSFAENVAMCVGMVLFVGFNYLGQRLFVFKEKEEAKE
ncbi:MAG: GtrA family protein [Firmicutes bacterium]|nr:GtrA family protein [Bacillota bacterium]